MLGDLVPFYRHTRILNLVIFILVAACIFSLLVYHSYKFRSSLQTQELKLPDKHAGKPLLYYYTRFTHLFTFLTLLCFFINTALSVLNMSGAFDPDTVNCELYTSLATLIYHTAHVSAYFIFILRLEIAFSESIYRYPQWVIGSLLAVVGMFFTLVLVFDFTETKGVWVADYQSNNDIVWWCEPLYAEFGLGLTAIVDILISVICLYLFLSPLHKLLSNVERDASMTMISIKYTILTVSAIGSTFVAVTLSGTLTLGILIAFDNVINSICVMMLCSIHAGIYTRLCGKCHNGCYYLRNKADKTIGAPVRMKSNSELGTSSNP